jgi:hypothetical protein
MPILGGKERSVMGKQIYQGKSSVGKFSVSISFKGGHSARIPEGTAEEIGLVLGRIGYTGEARVNFLERVLGSPHDSLIKVVSDFEDTTNSFVIKVRPNGGDNGSRCKYRVFLGSDDQQRSTPDEFFRNFCEAISGLSPDDRQESEGEISENEESSKNIPPEKILDDDDMLVACLLEHVADTQQSSENGKIPYREIITAIEGCGLCCLAADLLGYLTERRNFVICHGDSTKMENREFSLSEKGKSFLGKICPRFISLFAGKEVVPVLGLEDKIIHIAKKAAGYESMAASVAELEKQQILAEDEVVEIEKRIQKIGEQLILLKNELSGKKAEIGVLKKKIEGRRGKIKSSEEAHKNLVALCGLLDVDASVILQTIQTN